mgnify:CR=1 FL=1
MLKVNRCPALERLAIETGNAGFEREAAAHAGGQVAIEVVHPVLAVGPAALAFFDAVDIEGIELARVAEGNHGRREARGRLSHALHFALRRKELDRLRAERGHPRGTERHAHVQDPGFHASAQQPIWNSDAVAGFFPGFAFDEEQDCLIAAVVAADRDDEVRLAVTVQVGDSPDGRVPSELTEAVLILVSVVLNRVLSSASIRFSVLAAQAILNGKGER